MKFLMTKMIQSMPQNKISKWIGDYTKSERSKLLIKPYAKLYKVNTNEAALPIEKYKTMNEFFTRKLKIGERLIDQDKQSIISPVDGTIAQFGKIEDGQLVQAKGINYTVEQLLDSEMAQKFKNGTYMTIYLSPKDYHRIHMPMNGEITGYDYIPGRLNPVNEIGVEGIDGVFTKNERLATYFKAGGKSSAIVKVGAFIVGSVQISYEDNVHNKHRGERYIGAVPENLMYGKGEEIGWFEFGSTVILLFEERTCNLGKKIKIGQKVKMGEKIGTQLGLRFPRLKA